MDNVDAGPSFLRRRGARRRAERRNRVRLDHDNTLARRVQEIFFGCGLSQAGFSIGAGRTIHVPIVVSVVVGPPVALIIRLLPGQTPSDLIAHASAIAYGLDMTEVRVVPLAPPMIRLELLP